MSLAQQQQAAESKRSPELADIFRTYGESYRQAHSLPRAQLKVMHAIESCRTAALGGHLQQCDSCGYQQPAYNSCRNRHCPKCGSLAKAQWLEDRKADLLPVGYFHLVFTLPHELNPLLLVNKKVLCDILFKAVSQTLLEFGHTHLGGLLGFICVLHTWDQTLRDHFHLHCLIPGGALLDLQTPKSGWDACWRRLVDAGVLSLPDARSIDCEGGALDGMSYVVETNMDKTYRTYMYDNPQFASCKEAKQMIEIVDILYEEFGRQLPRH